MEAGLTIGRQTSETGYLDVSELSRIASELYAESFPAGSSFGKEADFPSNASLSHIASDSVLPSTNAPTDPI